MNPVKQQKKSWFKKPVEPKTDEQPPIPPPPNQAIFMVVARLEDIVTSLNNMSEALNALANIKAIEYQEAHPEPEPEPVPDFQSEIQKAVEKILAEQNKKNGGKK
jgi:hypothetical protein